MLLSLSQKTNQWLGKFLLKYGIRARVALTDGVMRDNPHMDAALLLPLAMRLVALEAYEEGEKAVARVMEQPSSTKRTKGRDSDSTEALGEIRLQVLESYVRPTLLPNEQWSDVMHWRFHQRLVKWLRKEFLLAKYRDHLRAALTAYPNLRQSPQWQPTTWASWTRPLAQPAATPHSLPLDDIRHTSRYRLPLTKTLGDALDLHAWTTHKRSAATFDSLRQLTRSLGGSTLSVGSISYADLSPTTDLSHVSFPQLLDLIGARVSGCGPFHALCEQANVYQLWTREYIAALGQYLVQRADTTPRRTLLLEVGAGDGSLAACLDDYLEGVYRGRQNQEPPLVVATDDYSWSMAPPSKSRLHVEVRRMSVEQAVAAFPATEDWQVIVLCSWMPMNEDWTRLFREHRVDEYILMGECDDGQCGDNWLTWGNPAFYSGGDDAEDASARNNEPTREPTATPSPLKPYVVDGYRRRDLDALAPYQFSRFDSRVSKQGRTVSFRRRRNL